MPKPTLYRISRARKVNELNVEQVWTQSGKDPLQTGYVHVFATRIAGRQHLLALKVRGALSAFRIDSRDPWFTKAPTTANLKAESDVVTPLMQAGSLYLLAYNASGTMSLYPLSTKLELGPPFTFDHPLPPGASTGFTVVQPIIVRNLVYLLCYAAATGDVKTYALSSTATAPPGTRAGTPALLVQPLWEHNWAPEWKHFAFFELGDENFFFKINTKFPTVNIDHVLDEPARGTVEVGSHLMIDDAFELDIVRSLTLNSYPYLITYKKDGTTRIYQIRGDCRGWEQQVSLKAVAGATQIVPYVAHNVCYLLFY